MLATALCSVFSDRHVGQAHHCTATGAAVCKNRSIGLTARVAAPQALFVSDHKAAGWDAECCFVAVLLRPLEWNSRLVVLSFTWLRRFNGSGGVSSSSQAVGQNSASAYASSASGAGGQQGSTSTSSDGALAHCIAVLTALGLCARILHLPLTTFGQCACLLPCPAHAHPSYSVLAGCMPHSQVSSGEQCSCWQACQAQVAKLAAKMLQAMPLCWSWISTACLSQVNGDCCLLACMY